MTQRFDYEFYLNKNQLKLGSAKPVVVRRVPPTGAQEETFTE